MDATGRDAEASRWDSEHSQSPVAHLGATAGLLETRLSAHFEPSGPLGSLFAAGPFAAGRSRSDTENSCRDSESVQSAALHVDAAAGMQESRLVAQPEPFVHTRTHVENFARPPESSSLRVRAVLARMLETRLSLRDSEHFQPAVRHLGTTERILETCLSEQFEPRALPLVGIGTTGQLLERPHESADALAQQHAGDVPLPDGGTQDLQPAPLSEYSQAKESLTESRKDAEITCRDSESFQSAVLHLDTIAKTLETCLSELPEPIETTADGSDLVTSLERRRQRALPALAELVRNFQRRRPGSRLRWAAHCVALSDGVKDPGRHTFDSVTQFLIGETPFLETSDADYWAIVNCLVSACEHG